MVSAKRAGQSTSETADLLGFPHTQPSLGFTENDQKKRKYPQVIGEWPFLFELIRQQ